MMWLATSFGWLMPAVRPAKTIKFGDSRTLQIRARREKDLDRLRSMYMKGSLGPTLHTPNMDYEYRAYCEPAAFGMAVATMIMEIDYLKFKPTTERFQDGELHALYNSIWSVVLQKLSSKEHQYEYWTSAMGSEASQADVEKVVGYSGVGADSWAGKTGYGWDDDDEHRGWEEEKAAIVAELDELMDNEPKELKHEDCDHAQTDAGDRKCRDLQLRDHRRHIEEIKLLWEESMKNEVLPEAVAVVATEPGA